VMALVAADQAGTLLPLLLQRQQRQGSKDDAKQGQGVEEPRGGSTRPLRRNGGKAQEEQPETTEAASPAEEGRPAVASKSNLARKHRLRMMRQVAVQVLHCRRQMTDSFQQSPFLPCVPV
jgi:hypothetical protein